MRALLIIAALALAGCTQHSIRPDLGPIAHSCSAQCKASCLPDAWPRWQGPADDPRTWDAWPEQVGRPLRSISEQCEAARASCLACMRALEDVGVVCGVTRECGK
jgi:hypothetical protein